MWCKEARLPLFSKPVDDNPFPSRNTEATCPKTNFSHLFVVQNAHWYGNKTSHSHTRNEHLVALQQVAEGEICRLVLGLLPEPVAVALHNQRHQNQFVRVIYSRYMKETSLVVDLMNKFGSGFGKHGLSRRGLQTAGTETEKLKASI